MLFLTEMGPKLIYLETLLMHSVRQNPITTKESATTVMP